MLRVLLFFVIITTTFGSLDEVSWDEIHTDVLKVVEQILKKEWKNQTKWFLHATSELLILQRLFPNYSIELKTNIHKTRGRVLKLSKLDFFFDICQMIYNLSDKKECATFILRDDNVTRLTEFIQILNGITNPE